MKACGEGRGRLGWISKTLFFFRLILVRGVNARGSVEQTRATREAFSRLQSRVRSRVSRVSLDGLGKKRDCS